MRILDFSDGFTSSSTPTAGLTAGSVVFANSSGILSQDNSNLFWDNTNKRLGIGTPSPSYRLHLKSSTSNDGFAHQVSSAGEGGEWSFFTSQGSVGSETPSGSSQILGDLFFYGYASSAFRSGALIRATQSGSYTSNTVPAVLSFYTGDGSSAIAERMRISPTGYVGIATTSPTSILTIGSPTTGSVTAPVNAADIHKVVADSAANGITFDTFGSNNIISGRRAQGTSASKTALVNTAQMIGINGYGWDGTSAYGLGGKIDIVGSGTWSTTSYPTDITFHTVASASTTLTERMRLSSAGNLGIGLGTGVQAAAKLQVASEVQVTASGGATGQLLADSTDFYVGPTGAHNLRLQANGATRLLIDSSGKVGVGITPSTTFHSIGNIRQETSGNNYGLEGYSTTTHIFSLHRTSNDTRLAAYGKLLFSTNATTGPTTGTTAVTIDSSQNVGIGVTPTVRHHVLQSSDAVASYIQSTHATFTNSSFEINATRAANSAYNFARFLSGNYADAEFRFSGDGNGTCDGSWTGGGADYAEYFEWADGNPYNEDRRGHTVSLINNKIKIAESGETVIGVVSARPSVVGDGDIGRWKKKYLVDDFGSYILDGDGHRILNSEYNPELEYIPRNERPEWSAIGLMGKLRILKGQVTSPSWIKMRDISENIEEWLIK